jgi:hypothetical protein
VLSPVANSSEGLPHVIGKESERIPVSSEVSQAEMGKA